MIKKDEFQCECCKEIFKKGWSDDEANEEAQTIWGTELDEENGGQAIICEDCFKEFYEFYKPLEKKEVISI